MKDFLPRRKPPLVASRKKKKEKKKHQLKANYGSKERERRGF
jgi:hypothetical protein